MPFNAASNPSKFWYLEKFEISQKLKKDDIINMEKSMIMKKVDKNTFLHFPDMSDGNVYFLKEGMIKIIHTDQSGNEQIK
ncbi:MAG: hypothetical protein MUF42_10240 [Cytophagaceae bacterium]|jgi:hypothetical protein|nr:hypothetical protein [Cytophagaceae bacterium]